MSERRSTWISNYLLLVVAASFGASLAHAAQPITYTEVILAYPVQAAKGGVSGPAGSLGGTSFGGDHTVMTLTYHSDIADVEDFTATGFFTVTGQQNFSSVASSSVQVNDSATGAQLVQGKFQPYDGIYVSVDHSGGGIGFGSSGGPVGSSAFPGNPLYPYAFIFSTAYDLRSSVDIGPDNGAYSCVGFPSPTCGAPIPLQTDAGALLVTTTTNPFYSGAPGRLAFFSARTGYVAPLEVFRSTLSIKNASFFGTTAHFGASGKFTLGWDGSDLNPLTDAVTLSIMGGSSTFSVLQDLPITIPAGSFTTTSTGTYVYSGTLNGVTLSMKVRPLGHHSYSFSATGSTMLLEVDTPFAVGLRIGNNLGVTGPAPSEEDE
jgi:hypothetical protein